MRYILTIVKQQQHCCLAVSSVGRIQQETPDNWDSFRRRRTHGRWAWRVRRGRGRWPSRRWRRRGTHTVRGCWPSNSRGVSTAVAWTASESGRRTNCRAERATWTCTAADRHVIDWFWRLHKSRVAASNNTLPVIGFVCTSHQRRQFPFANKIRYVTTAVNLNGYSSLVRSVTGPNPNPNPNVVVDLRNKETLNSFSYVRPFRNSD